MIVVVVVVVVVVVSQGISDASNRASADIR